MTDPIQKMNKHSRKQRLRNARRKSGNNHKTKKPRRKDWILDSSDAWNDDDYQTNERILPRGEHERRRKLETLAFGERPEQQVPVSIIDADTASKGLVVEVSSGLCRIEIGNEIIICSLRGNIMTHETGYSNLVAVGDRVNISRDGNKNGVVERVLPRRSVLTRPHGRILSLRQIVVANVDQVLIVASWREPHIWPELIDRYLIAAQRNDLEAIICINKTDLIEDQPKFDAALQPYISLGYRILQTSTVSGEGIVELRALLGNSATVLAGLSGVGKSSLLTAVQPGLDLRTGRVSERGIFTGQGRHTTSQSSLWKLENGGFVIDTPGIRTFGIAGITQLELASWYPEIARHAKNCRYTDCTHITEPGCMVKDAVKSGQVSELRYTNYCSIRETLPTP
jgi:ribosome biogenesis GTPase